MKSLPGLWMLLLPACGPDPCTQLHLDFEERRAECGAAPQPPPTSEEVPECTGTYARVAQCQSECVEAADCDAFLLAGSAALALGNCMLDCQRMFEDG